jgi:CYTH domain-containing protein
MGGQAGKYARFELERRYFVAQLPEGIAQDDGWLITDHYVIGTRLRVRRMEPLGEGETIFKFGQKNVPSPPDFSRMTITNIYLSPGEYDVLASLPALTLQKRRYRLEHDGCVYSVDAFDGHLSGLILAEVGFETTDEMDAHKQLPAFALREVSDDIRFTGGALAAATTSDVAGLLA